MYYNDNCDRRKQTIVAKPYKASTTRGYTRYYDQTLNLPVLNGEVIVGDKTFEDYGLSIITSEELLEIYEVVIGGQQDG